MVESHGVRILALITDAYGGFGGIAQYNRDLLAGWASDPEVVEIVVVPRVAEPPLEHVPEKVRLDLAGLNSGAAYVRTASWHVLAGGQFDLIFCGHVNLAPLAWTLARLRRLPWLLQVHGIEAWTPSQRRAVRAAVRWADHVFGVSRLTLTRFAAVAGINPERMTQTPLALRREAFGVAPKSPTLLDRYGLADRKVLMTFGRMSGFERYKGFDEIIELLPRLRSKDPSIAYLAVGDGNDRPRLEQKARQLGVAEHVIFAGRIAEAEKADTFRLADAYVMPSSGEGFGFVILEAMACGVPAIASKTDGGREAVRDGMIGQLVRPDDPEDIIRAIDKALTLPREVPTGLSFFDVANFNARVQAGLGRALGRTDG